MLVFYHPPNFPKGTLFVLFIYLGASLVPLTVKNSSAMQETWVRPLDWEDPGEKGMVPTPVLLPGKSHGQRNLKGYSSWGLRELNTTE